MSASAFRRQLLRATNFKSHYRSELTAASEIDLQASLASGTVDRTDAYFDGANPFWVAAGGLRSIDVGVAPPIFQDDIILRGGIVGIRYTNSANSDAKSLRVFLIRTTGDPDFSNIPTTFGVGYDPTITAEFRQQVGSVLMAREFTLEQDDQASIEYKVPPQKIDQGGSINNVAYRLQWITLVHNTADPSADQTITRVKYWNLSFSGDVVTAGA